MTWTKGHSKKCGHDRVYLDLLKLVSAWIGKFRGPMPLVMYLIPELRNYVRQEISRESKKAFQRGKIRGVNDMIDRDVKEISQRLGRS